MAEQRVEATRNLGGGKSLQRHDHELAHAREYVPVCKSALVSALDD